MRELARVLMGVGGTIALPLFIMCMFVRSDVLGVAVGFGLGLMMSGLALDDYLDKKG